MAVQGRVNPSLQGRDEQWIISCNRHGAGHAGCEAALATARMGFRTVVFALALDSVA